ncbi:AsmA family protein [methane-oxidizing endosymbiont of Gigantopelta aegis]|uniref:AsmA family protein n=1 Tax=methane-oxidizing endosymbiont of Gigantopelta aegis TaxID=2794938 RepID=UPI0018DD612B|nr:AsmA family protein [methane-oxidizing endosymbiont of Gigantopelta aegis]
MAKLFKIVLSIIASLLALILIAAIAIPLFVDPNDYKPQIIELVKKQTGRDLTINGDLEISVFPWIGVSTGELALSNAKGFADRPFAKIEESNIKVKLFPLLSRKVEVSRIVLKGLDLYLAKNKRGISNWDDLIQPEKAQKQPDKSQPADSSTTEAAPALAALAIGGLSIENAHITWSDASSGQYIEIRQFNLNTDQLMFDQPVDVDLAFEVFDKKANTTLQLDLATQLLINAALDKIQFKSLTLNTTMTGDDLPNKQINAQLQSDIALDLTQQTLDISDLTLQSGSLQITAQLKGVNIKDQPDFNGHIDVAEFDLGKFLRNMGLNLNMRDDTALSRFRLQSQLAATDKTAKLSGLQITLDDSHLKGDINIVDLDKQAIRFNLVLDKINADRYLPPESKSSKTSNKVASPAAAAVAGATLFPVETLRKLNLQGTLLINALTFNKIPMQGVRLAIDAKAGLLKTQQSIQHLLEGSYRGQTVINVKGRTPSLALNEKLKGVQIAPLLKAVNDSDRMSGKINASVRLKGYGNTSKAIKSSLNGALSFNLSDSVIKGFNIQKMIDSIKTLLKGAPLPPANKNDQTLFSKISGTATVSNGIVKNNDLIATSSRVDVTGKGIINLRTDQIDYKIRAAVTKRGQKDKVKGIPLIIKISGPLAKPSYQLDVAAIALETNKAKIDKVKTKLLDKLDKKLGPGAADLLKSFF